MADMFRPNMPVDIREVDIREVDIREIHKFLKDHIGRRVVNQHTQENLIVALSKVDGYLLIGEETNGIRPYSTVDPMHIEVISAGRLPKIDYPYDHNGKFYDDGKHHLLIEGFPTG